MFRITFALTALLFAATPSFAARCGGDFGSFVQNISADAQAAGISANVVSAALGGVTEDGAVLSFDRRQRYTFNKTFEQYVSTRVGSGRINGGRAMLQRHAALFSQIEARFGVPRQILVAIWGLETDFGSGLGSYPTFSALATLAYDCRRGNLYRAELIDALMIVQRGLLSPSQMRGAWAGELGQTQFMPSAYLKYGVSSNGGRGGNLIGNSADALASTANFLQAHGWQRGAKWEEGQPNFAAILEWNNAPIYAKTIAEFADRLAEP
jgi:lytic murein transglycosylase